MTTDRKSILFVDDEPNVLQGLRRMLRPHRDIWDMKFCGSGEEALETIASQGPPDIVVSDMRMPGMNGVDFLHEVMRLYPETVRFALSGQVDSDMLVRAYSVTHQFLNKPFDASELERHVSRAFALRDHLAGCELNRKLLALGGVPAMPMACQTIRREMLSDNPDIDTIATAVEQDPGLSAKVLQIVNSSFLGLRHHIASIKQACTLLGLGNIQNIVLLAGVLSVEKGKRLPRGAGLDTLWSHSLRVALYGQALARHEKQPKPVQDDAYTAGLLHEVGKVLLALELPEELAQVLEHARKNNLPLLHAEREVLGATHAEISAYLLELWGIPSAVCRAIAFHDAPSSCPEEVYALDAEADFSPLTALHVASVAASACDDADAPATTALLDETYMERIGRKDKAQEWLEVCAAAEPADT